MTKTRNHSEQPDLRNPEQQFEHPEDIEKADGISNDEKAALLETWKNELMELQTATAENMMPPPGGATRTAETLRKVNEVLARVKAAGSGTD